MRQQFLVILLFCFCIQLAAADRYAIHRRDTTINSVTESSASQTTAATSSNTNGDKSTTSALSSTLTLASVAASSTSSSTASAATTTSSVDSSAIFNSTIPAGQLPITPVITPGFAVTGVILILTGAAYTLIGIKNKLLHISLSAAYLASLSVTVLILYVMPTPVSNAVQGAYVVAAVITGLILGGAACIFTELMEGLGCLLGGFCFSMWLLVLKPGGLLTTTSEKSIFIAAFTLAAFATSLTHHTRPYGIIGGVSFAGATAIVLGLDCFSRAGLKEFWAYIWDLNGNLFLLGTTTYPVTRGIRVEAAAIFILFLFGIVSQAKMWKFVKERREQRAAERIEGERNLAQEEEDVGRRIEHQTATEREQWESAYGESEGRDSGIGTMEKKRAASTIASVRNSAEGEIEMEPMPSITATQTAGLVMAEKGQGSSVTVRVARDPEPIPELDDTEIPSESLQKRMSHVSMPHDKDEKRSVHSAEREAKPEDSETKEATVSDVPAVVPLPFKVPESVMDGERSNRSSVATFADDDPRRLSKRLSAGTGLLRRLSQRSNLDSKRLSKGTVGGSTEDLVVPHVVEDDQSSIAATVDGLSDDEDMRSERSSMDYTGRENGPAEMAELHKEHPAAPVAGSQSHNVETTTVTGILDSAKPHDETPQTPSIHTASLKSSEPPSQLQATKEIDMVKVQEPENTPESDKTPSSKKAPESVSPESVASTKDSKPISIAKDRLPAQLSKVVMSYRTNEWAKHLSNAESPALDELQLAEYPADASSNEVAAPVNIEELQQTAENGRPAPTPRSTSQTARTSIANKRSSVNLSPFTGTQSRREPQKLSKIPEAVNTRAMHRTSSTPQISNAIVESPIEDNFPRTIISTTPSPNAAKHTPPPQAHPFGSTTTLLGKRNTFLRNKSTYSQFATAEPEAHSQSSSETGSIHQAAALLEEDDNMSLSTRRKLIRQSSLQSNFEAQKLNRQSSLQVNPIPQNFDSHQPKRQSSIQHSAVREKAMANWRASIQQELQADVQPRQTIERQRSQLWEQRQMEEQARAMGEMSRRQRDSAFDERMRRGDMQEAHREAMRKMQRAANRAL